MNEFIQISIDQWAVVAAFFLSLLAFTGIGILSSRKKQSTTEDYLLAGRSVSPMLVALSTVATMSSGFMFIGQIGFTYRLGLASMWMLVGWTIGDYLAWRFLYRRVRQISGDSNEISPLRLLKPTDENGVRLLVPLAGLVTVFYLSMYAAAQLKAGGTALQSIFGLPESLGAIIGTLIVVIYCFSGGIRASIWTDAAQSTVMFVSMMLLVVTANFAVGGLGGLFGRLEAIDPSLTSLFPQDLRYGFLLYFLGMVAGGFGVIGQPHLLVRSMCIQDASAIRRARLYYFLWVIPFYAFAIGVGLHARVLMPELAEAAGLASEQALPLLSLRLFPDILVGLVLAGLFSATMSTADSQMIACTSAVTQDIRPSWRKSYRATKVTTIVVACTALTIALSSPDGVFALVLDAWAVLSCTLGPLFVLRVLGFSISQRTGLLLMGVGFAVSNGWVVLNLSDAIYTNLPGMATVFISFFFLFGLAWLRSGRKRADRRQAAMLSQSESD